jgi:splicing factor 3B subunit 2
LQGKRGIEKPPFDLPDFIKKTGIMEMRAALQEKEDQRTLKAKMRERARPKLGKIDIDYQKLHDAFFKYALLCVASDVAYNFRCIGLCCRSTD